MEIHADPATPAFINQLLRALHRSPARIVLRDGSAGYTAAQILYKVHLLTVALRGVGIGAGTAVGVCMQRGPELISAMLALWHLGAVYVPIAPQLPHERQRAMVEMGNLQLLLTQQELQPLVETLPLSLLTVLPPGPVAHSCPSLRDLLEVGRNPSENVAAYLMFTSGSSGQPKGVLLSHGNLAGFFQAVATLWSPPPQWRYLGCASIGFDISLFELIAPLLFAGELVVAQEAIAQDPALLLELIARERIDVVQATPSLWQLLALQQWPANARPTLGISIGEALGKGLAQQLLQRCDKLWNLYGPTECTIWATAHPVSSTDISETAPAVVSIGQPLPGYSATVDAEQLVLGGVGTGLGYLPTPGAAQSRFYERDGCRYYSTGDNCRSDASGNLHFLGRNDNQVKINGYRIELDEIEESLRRHNSIAQAACLTRALHNTPHATQLIACIVCKPGAPNKDASRLNEWLATTLPKWMLPQRYLVFAALPLNHSGKLDRPALLQLVEAETATVTADTQLDQVAREIAEIFCEVLEVPAVGANDSFFDLGGSSMLSATLVLTINQRFCTNLSLRKALATPPTVRSLSALLQEKLPLPSATKLES